MLQHQTFKSRVTRLIFQYSATGCRVNMHCQDSGRIRVTAAELEAYWQHIASRARANGEAVPEGFDKRAVPMGLYGDDARYNLLGSKILLITLNSILESHRRVSVALKRAQYTFCCYL